MGWKTPKLCSSMSMMGPAHCVLVAILKAPCCMTWCMAWMEMLPGRCGEKSCVDRCSGVKDGAVGLLYWLLLGSITFVPGHVDKVGHGCLESLGRRSCASGKSMTVGTTRRVCGWFSWARAQKVLVLSVGMSSGKLQSTVTVRRRGSGGVMHATTGGV